jgi:hypothetical protein
LTKSNKKAIKLDVTINGLPVSLAATKSKDGELVIVIASMNIGDPLNHYRLRWLIELFFKSIKSQGFKLEETHMTNPIKIKKLFALIALATLYAVLAGAMRHCFIKKIPIKKHGRPTYSIFTYGLDFLRALLAGKVPSASYHLSLLVISPPIKSLTDLSLQQKSNFALCEA